MPQPKRPKPVTVYQLKITLKHTSPPIWRRVQVRSDTTLAKLHDVVQAAMGWYDAHLHEFTVAGTSFGHNDPLGGSYADPFEDTPARGEETRLDQLKLKPRSVIRYEYDFGDSWEHTILVEKELPLEAGVTYPRCVAGRRACPPEDCGGVWGYAHLIEVMADPKHPEHEEMREWLGGPLDPEAFDLDEVNRRLAGEYVAEWDDAIDDEARDERAEAGEPMASDRPG